MEVGKAFLLLWQLYLVERQCQIMLGLRSVQFAQQNGKSRSILDKKCLESNELSYSGLNHNRLPYVTVIPKFAHPFYIICYLGQCLR